MDEYHKIHGHDIASFDTGDTHRLPVVSATQALESDSDPAQTHISTGLNDLDRVLSASQETTGKETNQGGIRRGQITEIWGPSGSGKSALSLQLAASAICQGNRVLWIDCGYQVQPQRVLDAIKIRLRILDRETSSAEESALALFSHHQCLTLPHLLALILRPTPASVPADVSLIVLDTLSALINSSLPKPTDGRSDSNTTKGPSASVKRRQGLQALVTALQKLAATRNCAVVIHSQCATRMHYGRSATLTPAINATVWEQGLATRLVLFRDWVWRRNEPAGVLLAGIQKLDGKQSTEVVDHVTAFQISEEGLVSVPFDSYQTYSDLGTEPQQKRKLGQTDLGVPDGENDEDYGWVDEDEAALPDPPPQWQGSEDILLGHDIDRSEDDEEGYGALD